MSCHPIYGFYEFYNDPHHCRKQNYAYCYVLDQEICRHFSMIHHFFPFFSFFFVDFPSADSFSDLSCACSATIRRFVGSRNTEIVISEIICLIWSMKSFALYSSCSICRSLPSQMPVSFALFSNSSLIRATSFNSRRGSPERFPLLYDIPSFVENLDDCCSC